MVAVTVNAVTVYPNIVNIKGKVGTKSAIQFKVYGHPTIADIDIVKSNDLNSTEDKVLKSLKLGPEQQYIVPMDIIIKENTQYYICAVLKKSESMRLRTCGLIKITAIP